MVSKAMCRRSLKVLMILAGLLVGVAIHRSPSPSDVDLKSSIVGSYHPIRQEIPATTVRHVAIPFSQYLPPHFSVPTSQSPLTKHDGLTIEKAKCKGEELWEGVQNVYRGVAPSQGRTFTQSDIDNGWTMVQGRRSLPPSFQQWSQDTIGQSEEYTLEDGREQDTTDAEMGAQYIRSAAAIIATDLVSPLHNLMKEKGLSKREATALLPRLSRWSDVTWLVWSDIARREESANGPVDTLAANHRFLSYDPARLHYLGHEYIQSEDTVSVMEEIFERSTQHLTKGRHGRGTRFRWTRGRV
ncbi:MAG: hypothetical protein Q9218_001517 [Villophora microphyllina]